MAGALILNPVPSKNEGTQKESTNHFSISVLAAETNEFKFEVVNTEVRNCMGSTSPFWNAVKTSFTAGLISLTVSDRYASISHIDGHSMSPTLNPLHETFLGPLGGMF